MGESASPEDGSVAKYVYVVSPEQRKALLSRDGKECESAFGSLKKTIRETYDDDGFVLIRGLFDPELLTTLCKDGQAIADAVKLGSTFTSLKFGPAFVFPTADEKDSLNGQSFRDTSLTSAIPSFIANILFDMDKEEESTSLRLLKDAFLAKGKEQKHCGWHVDDAGFWPVDASSDGVNVWIALDNMPAKYGGGMAVSPKSHHAEWRQAAYETIGSTKVFPPEGIDAASKLFTQVYGKTCDMETLDPELNERVESSKIEFDYQVGDCLFCTRWLFHRSVQINEEGLKHYSDEESLKRYTVRYERGNARLMRGLSLEPCVLMHSENGGKCLDEVCEKEGPFYPICWPPMEDPSKQEAEMEVIFREKLPGTEGKRKEIMTVVLEMINKAKAESGGY